MTSSIGRLRWLIEEQRVRPEDILVLAHSWDRVGGFARAIESAALPSVVEVHVAKTDQDRSLRQRGRLTLSTVASAKGYDAYCVLIASVHDFPTGVRRRASFYVGCTRAIEHLEVFVYERKGLVVEMKGPWYGPIEMRAQERKGRANPPDAAGEVQPGSLPMIDEGPAQMTVRRLGGTASVSHTPLAETRNL